MFKISLKNRFAAIGVTIVISLLATTGLFFAISNLTNPLISYDKIASENTVLQIELFSPLLASIKSKKPVNDFETINNNLQSGLAFLTDNQLKDVEMKDLMGSTGHSMIAFTAEGQLFLVTEIDNKFIEKVKLLPLFSNSKTIDNLIVYSNNQELLTKIDKKTDNKDSFLISFNDLIRINVLNNLFKAETLSSPLANLKNTLQPLEKENSSFSASIQQSSHRTKIQFFNLDQQNTNDNSSTQLLINLFPKNISSGYLANNSTSTIEKLSAITNGELLNKYLEAEQPILYAKKDNDWLIAIVSDQPQQIEKLTALFANIYDIKTVETSLPDGSYAKELKIKDVKSLNWKDAPPQNIHWKLKTNPDTSIAIASNDNIQIAGTKTLVEDVILKNGYFPQDCQVNGLQTAVTQKINDKILYYSENAYKNAVFCIFN